MIGKLIGIVDSIENDSLILDVHGIGYIIYVTNDILSSANKGQDLILYTDMIIKEEQITLYGFSSVHFKKWFKLLQTVQGVGAKMSLSILNVFNPDQLITAILSEDQNIFKQVSGVGGKIASRIVNELKHKESISNHNKSSDSSGLKSVSNTLNIITDGVSALTNLGFNRSEAYKAVTEIYTNDESISLQQLIKQGLAKLNK